MIRKPFSVACCVALLPLTALAQNPRQRHIDAIFPASSYAVARFGGLDRCKSAAEGGKLFALARDLLAKARIDLHAILTEDGDLEEGLRELHGALSQVGLKPADLRELCRGEMAFGFGRPTLYGAGMPSMLLAIDMHGREKAVLRVFDTIESRAVKMLANAGLEYASERFLNARITKLHAKHWGVLVARAEVDGLMLVGTGTGYIKDCIRTLRGEAASITANPAYTRGAGALQGTPLLSCFLNGRPFAQTALPWLPYEARDIGRALGIEGIDGIYWGSSAGARASDDVLVLGLPGNRNGLIKGLFQHQNSFKAAKLCPPETIAFATLSLDHETVAKSCAEIWQHIPTNIQKQAKREFRREAVREIDRELRPVGLRTRDLVKLLKLAGREVSVAFTMEGGRPQGVFFVELANPEKAQQTILGFVEKMLDQEGAPRLRRRKSKGIWFVSERNMPVQPAIAFKNGMLVFSPWLKTLEATLARADKGGASLADAAQFRTALEEAGPTSAFFTVRMRALLDQAWPLGRPLLVKALEQQSHGEIDAESLLPSKAQIDASMGDLTVSAIADDSGFVMRQSHPLGLATMAAVCGWGLDWFLRKASGKTH